VSREQPKPWCVWCAREIWGVAKCRKHGGVRTNSTAFWAAVSELAALRQFIDPERM